MTCVQPDTITMIHSTTSSSTCLDDNEHPIATSLKRECSFESEINTMYDSHVSVVSIEDYSSSNDDIDYDLLTTNNDCCLCISCKGSSYEHFHKKVKYSSSKKTVRFADMVSSSNSTTESNKKPDVIVLSKNDTIELDEATKKLLFWSKDDLNRFQLDAKMMHAMDSDVRDYVDVYHRARDHVIQSSYTSSNLTDNDLQMFMDGLEYGWRGLESFSSSQQLRKRTLRKTIQSIIAVQYDYNVAEVATSLTESSAAWASVLGQLETLIAKMMNSNTKVTTTLLRNVFENKS